MKNKFKKIMFMSLAIMTLSVVSVSAGYVTCQQTAATGYGYYEANCYNKTLRCHGYYDSVSEKYTVMNYIGNNTSSTKWYSGCHAGKRNGDVAVGVSVSFNSYAHTHSFTVNMD